MTMLQGIFLASLLECTTHWTEVFNYCVYFAISPVTRTESGIYSQCAINKYLLNESKSAETNWTEEQVLGHMK